MLPVLFTTMVRQMVCPGSSRSWVKVTLSWADRGTGSLGSANGTALPLSSSICVLASRYPTVIVWEKPSLSVNHAMVEPSSMETHSITERMLSQKALRRLAAVSLYVSRFMFASSISGTRYKARYPG